MTSYRGSGSGIYNVGEAPPYVNWTFVKGDTASFRVYVTDDARQPLNIPDWTLAMQIKRPDSSVTTGTITDNATLLYDITPSIADGDGPGEFTVFLTAEQTASLMTRDIFDIELSLPENAIVWTVAQGKLTVLEDVTA